MPFWNIQPAFATGLLRIKEAYYNSMNFPFGYSVNLLGDTFFGNFDYGEVDYNTAFNVNMMLRNPFYIPYIPVNINQGMGEIDQSKVLLAADKTTLQCKFIALGTNLNNLLGNINSALASDDLTDGQRAELQRLKDQTEDLLRRREEFAEKSPNMELADAVAEMEALCGEYYETRDDFNDLMNKIQSGQDVTPPQEQKTPEQIAQEYESTLKPAIQELLDNPNVSEEDKQALRELQEKLEKAIQEGKSQDELNEIFNELQDKINGIQSNLPQEEEVNDDEDETPVEEMSVEDIKNKIKNEIKPALKEIQNDTNLDDDDKKALNDKLNELNEAIKNGASEEDIQKLYKELKDMITAARTKSKINQLKNSPYVPIEDIEEMYEKLEELQQAIADGAEDEEIQEILEDLGKMIADAEELKKDGEAEEAKRHAEAKKKAKEDFDKYMEEYKDSKIAEGNELYGYLPISDRKEIQELIDEINKGIQEGRSAAKLNVLIDKLKTKVKMAEEKAQKIFDESLEISGNIFKYSQEATNDFIGWNYTEAERNLIQEVGKINKDNVIGILKSWNDKPFDETNVNGSNDLCILESIDNSFVGYMGEKRKISITLMNYLLDAILAYAKENNIHGEVQPYIDVIKGHLANGKDESKTEAYKVFQNMLKNVFNIPPKNY